ncbi:conserved hypothetical protein [Theileria orientalis strain Shintoku]|uniref:Symplekin C-terminal domain-containing protein n=1 Tax=Theileria orientalis strain Shintoku TaxID=869250 RepID=J4C993_THEOR|nr:conserved hypothetical protein [Theileria orientalis strain Shintoku]BAM42138.1 conserved hypothetical protein [Theileria orientalis strain Shintoku]|eukprot:XP_009692439.1 conserved hypothetical protein [Theileria orientalis strain Shintoku]
MNLNESNEGSLPITESSQEWHILNLLRVGERELFETNLQEFRKIQLTESQDGKVRLCKLINEVLRLDPQYSIILVEDLSHLFNDSNFVVQKHALFSITSCLNILISYIVASNALVQNLKEFGPVEAYKTNHMGRCRSTQTRVGAKGSEETTGVSTQGKNEGENEDISDKLPFAEDNLRVLESFSDLACIRFIAHIRLLEETFADVKYKSLHSLHYLIHTRNRLYSVNTLKLLFYELANYPNYLCRQCTENTHEDGATDNSKGKPGKDAKNGAESTEEGSFDMYDTLYKWHKESVQLLQYLISSYLDYKKKKEATVESGIINSNENTRTTANNSNENTRATANNSKGEKENVDESGGSSKSEPKLVGCILSSEVASCLISFYPDYYFNEFVDFLVPLLKTEHAAVFENILFRIFASSSCIKYHHVLLEKVNKQGYNLDLKEVYKLVQSLPSRQREMERGSMVVVEREEVHDKNKLFDITDKLVSSLEVEVDVKLSEYPAAQLFEFDKELVKNYRKIKNTQIKINRNFYKHKPADLTQILYPSPYKDYEQLESEGKRKGKAGERYKQEHENKINTGVYTGVAAEVAAGFEGQQEHGRVNEGFESQRGLERRTKELKIVTDEVIAQNEKLFVRLVGSQMVDTVATYKRFLRFEVVAQKQGHFDAFSKLVLNHCLLSNLVEFENSKEVMCTLLNHMAEHILVNDADMTHFRQNEDFGEVTYGLRALFMYVNQVREVSLFVKYLNRLNDLVVYSYTTNLAKSLVTYRSVTGEGDDHHMKVYESFVNLALSYVCAHLSEMDEYGDFCVHALSKFVLNLPKVPSRIADLIVLWVNSNKQGNVKLAFSLVSNLLKLSETVTRVNFESVLGRDHYKYTSNLSFVRRSIFVVFLTCITSEKETVSELFLKLISSQKGLYKNNNNYTLKSQEALHEEFLKELEKARSDKASKGEEEEDMYDDCVYLSTRPLWQWPTRLVELLRKTGKYKSLMELTEEEGENGSGEDTNEEGEEEVNEDIGAWIEESVTLMSLPNRLKTSTFIATTASNLATTSKRKGMGILRHSHGRGDDEEESEMDVDDGAYEAAPEGDAEEAGEDALKCVYYEPLLACCSKNSRLVFRLADLASKCVGSEFYVRCSQTLSKYPKELQLLIKYGEEYSELVESALKDTRKRWSDLMFKYDERSNLDKELMLLLIRNMQSVPEYLIQMAPFLSPAQLDTLMVFLFRRYEKEKLVKILDIIIETPKVALPQHFLYSTYNFQVASTATSDKERDYMKLQVSLLDTCITYCTHGKFSVESAISSLYLIVESFENINFVFGRLLCQFVQKIPLTRKVVVDVIFPKLIQRQCWQDKQLFKGVVLSICTLWNQFKDQLMRYAAEMPSSSSKMVLRALHSQHNLAEYARTATVPPNMKELLEEVVASTQSRAG